MSDYELKIVQDLYVEEPKEFIQHRRASNFIARIVGLHPSFGLTYDFLERVRVGRETFYQLKDFIPNEYYIISSKYYTGSGRLGEVNKIFLKCVEVTKDKVKFEIVSEKDVVNGVKNKYPNEEYHQILIELERVKSRLKTLSNLLNEDIKKYTREIDELNNTVVEYLEEFETLQDLKKELELKVKSIVNSKKDEYNEYVKLIRNYSVIVAKAFGVKKDFNNLYYEYTGAHVINGRKVSVTIKTQGEEPYYMRIDPNEYIFVADKNPSPRKLVYGFKVLKKIIEDNLSKISTKIDIPELNVDEILKVKEESYRKLKELALKTAKAFGEKTDRGYVLQAKGRNGIDIVIKAGARSVKYFKVGSSYLISQYGEPSLNDILYGLLILSDFIKSQKQAINDLKR